MESLPLKELDFGLQKPTGPSSGVVASILLIIIALSSVTFFFFLHNSHTFQIVLEDTCTSNHFSGTFKNQNCCCFKNHKKSKLCHEVNHWKGFVLLYNRNREIFFFPFYCLSYLDFCEKCLKKNKKNSKKIMKSAMGILSIDNDPLWPLNNYFFLMMRCLGWWSCNLIV